MDEDDHNNFIENKCMRMQESLHLFPAQYERFVTIVEKQLA